MTYIKSQIAGLDEDVFFGGGKKNRNGESLNDFAHQTSVMIKPRADRMTEESTTSGLLMENGGKLSDLSVFR